MRPVETSIGEFAKRLVANPYYLFCSLGTRGLLNWMSDELYLKLFYRGSMGRKLDIENPQTFNEKLQWLKLHDRNPLYTRLVDKFEVKNWVAEKIGVEYVVPTLGLYDSFDDIDFDALPERFVLKCTHDSGGIAICRNRDVFDTIAARAKLTASLSRNYYWYCREWPYKEVKPRIIAEEYLDPGSSGSVVDYKLFHFNNGRCLTLVCEDREAAALMSKTYFDEDWHVLSLREGGHPQKGERPQSTNFDKMKQLADKIASGFPFCRVDFYESDGSLYFGEVTFYPAAGLEDFVPSATDAEWGSWIDLSGGGGGGGYS